MRRVVRAGVLVLVFIGALGPPVSAQVFDPSKVLRPGEDPGAAADDVEQHAWTIDFKDRLFTGLKYAIPWTLDNACAAARPVNIFIKGLPQLSIPELSGCGGAFPDKACAVTVPPGQKELAGVFQADAEFYYRDPLLGATTPQPFTRVTGEIVVYHPQAGDCLARRDAYQLNLDLYHLPGAVPPPPPGPEKIASAGPCQVWWNTGQKPTNLRPDQRCEAEIRPLALGYRERVLPPHIANAPGEWAWLPSPEQIAQMSSDDLVAMKLRAERLIAR